MKHRIHSQEERDGIAHELRRWAHKIEQAHTQPMDFSYFQDTPPTTWDNNVEEDCVETIDFKISLMHKAGERLK